MAIVPKPVQDFLDFAEQHGTTWNSVYAQIGVSTAQASAYKTAAIAARGIYNDALAADLAKKAAFNASRNAVSDLRVATADILALIKAHADNAADPGAVYDAAQIPQPQPPQPAPPPGTPSDVIITLAPEGWVQLGWKCSNPEGTTGTIYEVRRKTGSGEFQFIGASGVKRFTDDTLPAGSSNVTYLITAVRSTQRGISAQIVVNFGVGGNGFTVTNVKLAA